MNPLRLIVYLVSWSVRVYQDIKARASDSHVDLKKEYFHLQD